jgi:crotonobetainyl-CoA:carnitine CoA-transferase CaiB-like acyl-CoA transferase
MQPLMQPLAGHIVVALGAMLERPLARYLASLGAEVVAGNEAASALERASFLIDDLGLPELTARGLPRTRIAALNPQLVHVSVTAFGSTGPRARWKGGELVISAMGGVLRLTGEPDRPPVKEALDACLFHADMVAAAGAMAAHYARGRSGAGQHIDVSAQEVAFSRNVSGVLVWQFDHRKLRRVGGAINYGKSTVRCIWQLADGWCFHSLMTGRFGAPANQALSDWMDEAGARNPLRGIDWLRYDRSALPPEVRRDWESAIAAFFLGRTRLEVAGEGRRRGINACVLATPADVLAEPHLQAREFWARGPGGPCARRFAALRAGPAVAGTAGNHSTNVQSNSLAPAARERVGPLAGIRVLDFSWALVGSITTKVLGDLGADVIKVESRARPCLSRLDVQVAVSKPGELDDKPWFAHLNTSKRSLALDLKRPESREVIDPLLGWADVVVENFSPGTLAKLDLDYERVVQRNPRIVMVSGSVYGQTGPLAREWGVDGTGAALSGRTLLTGRPDGHPVIPGAVPYGDVIVPYVMAATVLAALEQRREGGRGAYIDASMYEICVQQMWPAIRAAHAGAVPARSGNADSSVYWQAVLPAAGEDRWVAVTIADERERKTLQGLAGGQSLEAWSASQPETALVERLQAQGIAAGVVQDMEDLVERDPGLRTRGALVVLDHPLLGPFAHMRTPLSFSVDAVQPFRAPRLGEHNREIVHELLGLPLQRLEALQELGVFT